MSFLLTYQPSLGRWLKQAMRLCGAGLCFEKLDKLQLPFDESFTADCLAAFKAPITRNQAHYTTGFGAQFQAKLAAAPQTISSAARQLHPLANSRAAQAQVFSSHIQALIQVRMKKS